MSRDDRERFDGPQDDAAASNPPSAATESPPARPPGGIRVFQSLAVPQYRRYTLSFIAGSFSLQALILVRAWLAFDLTRSPLALGTVLVAMGASRLVVSPIGGVLADRLDRKLQILAGQGVMAVAALVLGLLVLTDLIQLWHLVIGAVVHGTVMSFQGPARQSFVYNLVGREHVANAVTLNAGIQNAMRLAAPATAGVLIGLAGAEVVYFLVVAGFVISIGILLLLVGAGQETQARGEAEPAWKAFTQGLRYIWQRQSLLWLVITALAGTGMGLAFRNMLPVFAKDALDLGPGGFGLLISMAGLGALIGSLGIAFYMSTQRSLGKLLLATGIMWGVLLALLGLSPNIGLAIGALLFLGACSTGFNTFVNILIQTTVEDAFRGRVLSFYMLTFSVHTFGSLPIGALAEQIGIRETFVWTGIALVAVMSIIAAKRGDIRRMT